MNDENENYNDEPLTVEETEELFLNQLYNAGVNLEDPSKLSEITKALHAIELAEIESARKLQIEEAKLDIERERLAIDKEKNELELAQKLQVEQEKLEVERERLEVDKDKNELERKSGKRRMIADVARCGFLALVSVWGTLYTTKFEKTDSYTSTAGRGFSRSISDLFKKG